jgi:hypothetical protein
MKFLCAWASQCRLEYFNFPFPHSQMGGKFGYLSSLEITSPSLPPPSPSPLPPPTIPLLPLPYFIASLVLLTPPLFFPSVPPFVIRSLFFFPSLLSYFFAPSSFSLRPPLLFSLHFFLSPSVLLFLPHLLFPFAPLFSFGRLFFSFYFSVLK